MLDGTHPRAWIVKCSNYFKIAKNGEEDQKVSLALMYFEGRVALWFHSLSEHSHEVQRIYCPLEVVTPLSIKVANEQKMTRSHEVIDFSWAMQGTTMTWSLRLLQNEGCDIILGCDWFKKHTPVTLDYNRMRVKIRIDGRRVRLQALKSIAICILLSHQSLYKLWHTHDRGGYRKCTWHHLRKLYYVCSLWTPMLIHFRNPRACHLLEEWNIRLCWNLEVFPNINTLIGFLMIRRMK